MKHELIKIFSLNKSIKMDPKEEAKMLAMEDDSPEE